MTSILFKSFVGFLIVTLVFYLSPVPLAHANPVGGSVSSGSATITNSGNTETIHQTTGKAVIDWTGFNINSGETTNFVQPNSSSLTVNRVHDMNPSQIFGSLTANGNLVLINPNGVFFGQGSKIDVNGLLATTSNVANGNVMNGGTLHFTPGSNPNASVVNAGTITAADAGLVGLVAPNVQNSGVITARLGKVQLSSGDSFDLDFYGDNLLKIGVSDQVGQQMVQNLGLIEADGGTVKLTAAAGRSIVNSLIDVEGQIKTPAFRQQNGEIEIYAAGSNAVPGNIAANKGMKTGASSVQVSGTLDASGKAVGQSGGNISVLGDDVNVMSGANIDASGTASGGYIKIGGDFHGAGTTPTALSTSVQNGAIINASSLDSGNGGNVAVWSDNYTNFAGSILARGGPNGGNGGFVETSGHKLLSLSDSEGNTGTIDASAPKGKAGTWLLDPYSVTIGDTDAPDENNDNGTPLETITPGSNNDGGGVGVTSNISHTTIETALNAGTNVLVTTGSNGSPGTDVGDITVNSAITATTGTAGATGDLTLSAFRNIIVNAPITLGGTNTGPGGTAVTGGSLTLNSDNGGNQSGYIDVTASIATNGGNITMGGGSGPITAGTLNANGTVNTAATGYAYGNATLQGGGPEYGPYGVVLYSPSGTIAINAGSGNIIINGHGYNNDPGYDGGYYNYGQDMGVYAYQAALQTTSGNIAINGIAGSGSGAGNEAGIVTTGAITTTSGAISLVGIGGAGSLGWMGASGAYNMGVEVDNNISSTGTGTVGAVTINGTGGPGSQQNNGVNIDPSTISVADANLYILGTAGNGSNPGYTNDVGIANFGTIKSTGAGNIAMTGYGGNYASGSSQAGFEYGISNLGTIESLGTGSVTVKGYGGNATEGDTGVYQDGSITTASGTLDVEGYGGAVDGTASGNYGLMNYDSISSSCTSGCGAVTIIGTGAAGSSNNYGIVQGGGTISTVAAPVTITGTSGAGTSTGNYGTYIQGGNITSTGTGSITINSTGGNGAVDFVDSGANTIGGTLDAGDITLNQNTATWNSLVVTTGGNLNIGTLGSGNSIDVGTLVNASNLQLVDATLANFTWGAGKTLTIGNATSGNVTVNSADSALLNTGNLTFMSGTGNVTLTALPEKTSGGNGTLTVQAAADIIDNSELTTDGTGDPLNVLFDANSSNTNSGYIDIENNIATNGGNITMGGGEANPANIVAGTGYAWGNAAETSAISIFSGTDAIGGTAGIFVDSGTVVNAGTGNIVMNGHGGNVSINSPYIYSYGLNYGIFSMGSISGGGVSIYGTGGTNTGISNTTDQQGNNYGIFQATGTISAGSGGVTLNGSGGSTTFANTSGVAYGYNYGIVLEGTVQTTGSGAISITGMGGSATGGSPSFEEGYNYGILGQIGTISAGNGGITLNGTGGSITFGSGGSFAGGDNMGDYITGSETIQTTGSGTISIAGTGGTQSSAGWFGSNYGIYDEATISSVNGAITLNGSAPDSVGSNGAGAGVEILGAITSTGTGTIGITGTSLDGAAPIALGANATTNNKAITFNDAVQVGTSTVNAGTGTVTFASTVDDFFANTSTLTVTGGTVNLEGAIGGTTPLNAVSITAANAMTLPAISAADVTAVTTGATADIALEGNITASGTGNALVIASGRNFDNAVGSGVFDLTGGGRWIVYSTALAGDTNGASQLNPIQTINGQTYGSEAPGSVSGASNTWVYSSSGTSPGGGGPAGGGGSGNGGGGNIIIPPIVIPPVVVAPAPTPAVTPAPAISNNVVPTEQEVANIPVIWNSEPVPNDNPGGLRFVNQPAFAPSEVAFQVPEINAPVDTPAVSNNGAVQQSPDPGDAKPDQKKPEDKKDTSRQSRFRELRDRIMRAGRLGRLRLGGADKPELQPAS